MNKIVSLVLMTFFVFTQANAQIMAESRGRILTPYVHMDNSYKLVCSAGEWRKPQSPAKVFPFSAFVGKNIIPILTSGGKTYSIFFNPTVGIFLKIMNEDGSQEQVTSVGLNLTYKKYVGLGAQETEPVEIVCDVTN